MSDHEEDSICGSDIIHSYSRLDAISDGTLIDLSTTSSEMGFLCPVAITAVAWEKSMLLVEDGQSDNHMRTLLSSLMDQCRSQTDAGNRIKFLLPNIKEGHLPDVTLNATIGGGDHGEMVLTIMMPDED
jgi:hypothetical protein